MKNSRWSKEHEATLLQTVQRASTARKGIRTAARKLKRTPNSCSQRYYMLQKQVPANKKLGYTIPVKGKVRAITITNKGINLIFS